MSKDCEHLISDENDECYPCKVKALFRIIGEREEELKLVSEQRDLIAKKADSDNSEKRELRGKLEDAVELLEGRSDPIWEVMKRWKERAEKAEKKRDHWESLWKKSSMSVIGLQESNKELDKLKGFLSVERNKVEGWVEKCADKDKRIGMLREPLEKIVSNIEFGDSTDEDMEFGLEDKIRKALQATQPKPTTPSVPSDDGN